MHLIHTQRRRRSSALALVAALAVGASTLVAPPAGATAASAATATTAIATPGAPGALRRSELDVRVRVGVDGLSRATLHAVRYTPSAPPRGVQVLVPGVTYDHRYYDLHTSRGVVSQAQDAARDGWVTIAVDRLGTGGSSTPPADKVTTATNVASLARFVAKVDRLYPDLPVVLVGHSYGSVVAEGVAARSDAVDALVVTGFLYRQTAPSFDGFPELVPASDDPVLAGRKLPDGYLTTAAGSRGFFHSLPDVAAATVRADERSKATTTGTEVPGFATELFGGAFAARVRVPVLVVVGEHDFLQVGNDPTAFAADQRTAFERSESVRARLVPDAGHDLALSRNAGSTTAMIDRWASRQVG